MGILRQIHFSKLAHPTSKDNLWVAIISCQSVRLSWSKHPSLVSWRASAQRGASFGHHRPCFLHDLHVYPKLWHADCAGPPGKDKGTSLYMFWPVWGTISKLSSSSFCTKPGSCITRSSSVLQPEDTSGVNVWYEQMISGLKKTYCSTEKKYFNFFL